MTISDVTKPIVQAILGKPETAPPGTLEEAKQKLIELGFEIVELTRRPPSTSAEVERKRLDDLAVARRNLEAWEAVRDGLLQRQADEALAAAEVRAKEAVAAARHWSTEDVDALWAGFKMLEKRKALADEEFQATAMLSHLKSPSGGGGYGQTAQGHILTKGHEVYMDLLEALGLARKVSPSRGVWTLERIVEKGK
jgi:hypothetical protein